MQIRENGVYIEAIKLAAGSVQYKDISVKDTFIDAVLPSASVTLMVAEPLPTAVTCTFPSEISLTVTTSPLLLSTS